MAIKHGAATLWGIVSLIILFRLFLHVIVILSEVLCQIAALQEQRQQSDDQGHVLFHSATPLLDGLIITFLLQLKINKIVDIY